MGYTHYVRISVQHLDPDIFAAFAWDCERLSMSTEIPLAGWNGTGDPLFAPNCVSFNGVQNCGHQERDLGIVWPSGDPGRGGVASKAPSTGSWFAGAHVSARTCDGDCSHETFRIDRDWKPEKWQKNWQKEGIFRCCKTAYKPYDVLVTACLIALAHHFPDVVRVTSDGESRDWQDARDLCSHALGYGKDFCLPQEENKEEV